jgi:hypothetical protein
VEDQHTLHSRTPFSQVRAAGCDRVMR